MLSLLCGVFSTLSSLFEGFTPFEHSSSGDTCFLKLCFEPLKNIRWLDHFCSKKFDNNALFHASRHGGFGIVVLFKVVYHFIFDESLVRTIRIQVTEAFIRLNSIIYCSSAFLPSRTSPSCS